MTRVCIVGALGRMGTRLRELLPEQGGLVLGAALEDAANPRIGERLPQDVTLGTDVKHALATCDVAIDFSVPNATLALLHVALETRTALVIGTTGFEPAGRAAIVDAARSIPIVFAPNFSVSVNVLAHLVREAAARLGPDFDAEIVELHHAAKRDAPSGTALRLAEAVADGRGTDPRGRFVSSRSGDTGARIPGSIGLQALRGGDNPGEHTVLFIGVGERIELSHRAMTRDHFVRGTAPQPGGGRGRGCTTWGTCWGCEGARRRSAGRVAGSASPWAAAWPGCGGRAHGSGGAHTCAIVAVGGISSARRMITTSAVLQVDVPPTLQRAGCVCVAVGGMSSEREMTTASAVVTRPSPVTSPHWQARRRCRRALNRRRCRRCRADSCSRRTGSCRSRPARRHRRCRGPALTRG